MRNVSFKYHYTHHCFSLPSSLASLFYSSFRTFQCLYQQSEPGYFYTLGTSLHSKRRWHVASKSRTLQNDWWNLRHCSYSQFGGMIWEQTMKDWPDHVVISVGLDQFPCPLSFLFLPLIFLKFKCSLSFSRSFLQGLCHV